MQTNRLLTALYFSCALFAYSNIYAQAPTATIDEPSNGSQVISPVELSGTVSDALPKDHQLWIVVRKGELMWPKNPAVFLVGNDWSKTVSEGTRGAFSFVLFLVGTDGQEQINRWIETGNATGHFPGLEEIKGTPLAQVRVTQP